MPFLPPNQQRQSTEGSDNIKHILYVGKTFIQTLITTRTVFALTFWSLPETFVRRSCSVLLAAVLATVVMWRGKKSVVRVAQCIAVLVPVHRMLSRPQFLSGFPHKLAFLTDILILFMFLLPTSIRFHYLDQKMSPIHGTVHVSRPQWKEMGQLVSSSSVPHFCRTFGVYAVHLLFYKMPHEAGMRTR